MFHEPHRESCPDCEQPGAIKRRDFLRTTAVAAAAISAASAPLRLFAEAKETASTSAPETLVKTLFDSLKPEQKSQLCFAWDYQDPHRGLLRTHVSNNWNITKPAINSNFFTAEQKQLVRGIFEGIVQPDWHERIDKQLKDDAGGFGNQQSIALFGAPGDGKFEFVMTGRHMTLRCDGDSTEHVAFGGPIFYGHAASGFDEDKNHPGNVFWPQALAANKVFDALDERQRKIALVQNLPDESEVGFQGPKGVFPGIPLSEMSGDQRSLVGETLKKLLEPYRAADRDETAKCLDAQGGLERCSLAFYKDGDVGNDKLWDCWRLEGPAFVWYFRGDPHVHVWVNVADDPSIKLNSTG